MTIGGRLQASARGWSSWWQTDMRYDHLKPVPKPVQMGTTSASICAMQDNRRIKTRVLFATIKDGQTFFFKKAGHVFVF
jgi:hypothetical protein